MAQMLLYWLT